MPESGVTAILDRIGEGDASAAASLLSAVYAELRAMAQAEINRERPGHTLDATALVHEAYLRMVARPDDRWVNRAHFFASAALAMRRVLVEHARARLRQKRGSGRRPVRIDPAVLAGSAVLEGEDLVALDEALERLGRVDEVSASIVGMRYFAGMQTEQIALVLGLTDRTVRRRWAFARAWLYRELTGDSGTAGVPGGTAT